jgi:hypothetical protein
VWEWPLYSPARLAVTIAVIAALVVAVSFLLDATGTGGRSGRTPLGPAGTSTGAPADGTGAAPATPPPELTPTTLPLAAVPPAALEVAQRWVQAWATHPPGTTSAQWSAALAPYTTDEYLPVLETVDPANIPGSRVTGTPVAVEVRPEACKVDVPTDAVRLELLLVQVGPGNWRVSGYDRAS